jgi:formiminotetrahydrofolate cyclodeaminase
MLAWAALTALAAAEGAYFNVLINLGGLGESEQEVTFVANCLEEADVLIADVRHNAEEIRLKVLSAISKPLAGK